MSPFIPVFVLLAVFIMIGKHLLFPLLFSPLRHIPQLHWTSRFSSLYLKYIRYQGKTGIQRILFAHQKTKSPIILLSPNELSVASLDGLKQVYLGGFEKTSWYAAEFMNYKTPNLVSLMRNEAHSHQKRMMSHVYSKSSILGNSHLINSSTILIHDKLAPVLIDAARKQCDFDTYALNQAIGADFTSVFLLGIKNCTNFIGDLPAAEEFRKKYKLKIKLLPGHENATKQLENFVLTLCRNAYGANEDGLGGVVHAQLLSKLDNAGSSSANTKGEDNLIIASEIFDHLIAGVETTRITLTYLEWELSRSPSLQAQLRAELRTLSPPISLKASQSSLPALPDPKAIDSLPLLDAILKETLRLYPPSPALLPRVTPPGGAVINGFAIPAGTVIGSSSVCMHQNASVFPEPDKFKSERWLVDDERLREMNRWFWAFGSGGRMCIGNHFAIYLLKLIVAAIYTDFETSIVDDEGIEQEDAFLAGPRGEKLVLRFNVAA